MAMLGVLLACRVGAGEKGLGERGREARGLVVIKLLCYLNKIDKHFFH